jgi:hypothetical protein
MFMTCKLATMGKAKIGDLIKETLKGCSTATLALQPFSTKFSNLYKNLCKNPVSEPFKLTDKSQEFPINKNATAKVIRTCLMASRYHTLSPIVIQKTYTAPNIDNNHTLTLLSTMRRLTSVKSKNTLLRILNGDLTTKSRLNKMGLADNSKCGKCDLDEDKVHLLVECPDAKKMWENFYKIVKEVTGRQIKVSLMNILCHGNHASNIPIVTLTIELCSKLILSSRPILNEKAIMTIIKTTIAKELSPGGKTKGNEWLKWAKRLQN